MHFALVAQLDRVLASEAKCRVFESPREVANHKGLLDAPPQFDFSFGTFLVHQMEKQWQQFKKDKLRKGLLIVS